MSAKHALLIILSLLVCAPAALAEPTEIVVHVRAKGSKFIGTSMGGARVTIRDARSGRILDHGITSGSTGNTQRIMIRPLKSTQPLTDETTAAFRTSLDLERPTLIEVQAEGPLNQLQSANRASATQWVVPGKDISGGDAFLLEIQGLVVEILDPPAGAGVAGSEEVTVSAQVIMGCGCPLTPGGLWDPQELEIRGLVSTGNGDQKEFELSYAGTPSRFSGSFQPSGPGSYDLYVYAYNPANGNTGLDRTTFSLSRDEG